MWKSFLKNFYLFLFDTSKLVSRERIIFERSNNLDYFLLKISHSAVVKFLRRYSNS